ncbi:hypothetical protein [Pseudalkalibacillus sp. JSM 102089]|uniref:hypothetical protein n=1 Tax=Pseudalkalibacillus sp. JSM 102089 TaxID=3229856 RepID=UPI003524DE8E
MEAVKYLKKHHCDTDRFIVLGEKSINDGTWKQIYTTRKTIANHEEWMQGPDKYYSLNTFWRYGTRKAKDIRHLRALYVDIDCYNVGMTPVQVAELLNSEYFNIVIPEPNALTFTGKGLNCIWWIQHAPKQAIPTWKRVNHFLYERLKDLGADSKCDEPARMFRIPGTINSKNGNEVELSLRHENYYDLRELHTTYTPWEEKQYEPKPKKAADKTVKTNGFTLKTLNAARQRDLKKLQYYRNKDGISEGYRQAACWLFRYFSMCLTGSFEVSFDELTVFNQNFLVPLPESELVSTTRNMEKEGLEWAQAYQNKNLVTDTKTTPDERTGYQISNKRLIEMLDITEEEQFHMETIIGEEEKKRRDRIRKQHERKSAGQVERKDYLKQQKSKTTDQVEKLKQLIADNPSAKAKELADLLGVSRQHFYRLKKKI